MLLILIQSSTDDGLYETLATTLPEKGVSVSFAMMEDLDMILKYLPTDIKHIIWTTDQESLPFASRYWQKQSLPGIDINFIDRQMLVDNPHREIEMLHEIAVSAGLHKERK